MVYRLRLGAAVEANIIDPLLEVSPLVTDIGPALARLDELERTLHKVALAGGHRALLLSAASESLEMTIRQLGFRVKGVDV